MKLSQCRDCRRPIIWLKREDDPERWHPPLDGESGRLSFCVIDVANQEFARVTFAYQAHVCAVQDLHSNGTGPVSTTKFTLDKDAVAAAAEAWARGVNTKAVQVNGDAPNSEVEYAPEAVEIEVTEELENEKATSDPVFYHVDGVAVSFEEWRQHVNNVRDQQHRKNIANYRRSMDRAIVVKCSRCGAYRGVDCANLSERVLGRKLAAMTPHSERVSAAKRWRFEHGTE